MVGDFPVVSKTFVTDQLVHLAAAGHAVRILADRPTEEDGFATVPGSIQSSMVERSRSADGRAPASVRQACVGIRGLLRAPRVTVRVLRAPTHGSRRETVLRTALALLETGDADIFHCHFGPLGNDVLAARRRVGFSGRIVTAFHGYDLSSHIRRFGADVFADLLAEGDLFLPISEHWRSRLLDLGAPPERVLVQRMGVDTSRLRPVSRPRRKEDPLRILSIGRLVEKKGFVYGVRAVAQLRHRGVDAVYTVAGDGPEGPALTSEACRLGVDGRIRFLGRVRREEVRDLLHGHDVLLCPSVTAASGDCEGIPMVLMEAMATTMPVVSSIHSGIPELVANGVSGLLAEERDARAIADHLETLAGDPRLCRDLGWAGRRRVTEEFDVGVVARQLESRFLRLVGRSSASSH